MTTESKIKSLKYIVNSLLFFFFILVILAVVHFPRRKWMMEREQFYIIYIKLKQREKDRREEQVYDRILIIYRMKFIL